MKLSLATPSKALANRCGGRVPWHTMEPMPEQRSNAMFPIVSKLFGKMRPSNEEQYLNALVPMDMTLAGISKIPEMRELFSNAPSPITSNLEGSLSSPEKLQPRNASLSVSYTHLRAHET